MQKSSIARALCIPLLVVLLAGCAASSDATGMWGDPTVSGTPSLELEAGGQWSGTDGCNRLSGQWVQTENLIEFSNIASTRMFCLDIDTWLSTATSAEINGDALRFYDAAGNDVGELTKN